MSQKYHTRVTFSNDCNKSDPLSVIFGPKNNQFNLHLIYLRQRRRYMFCPCLFVCLLARLLKNMCMDLDEMLCQQMSGHGQTD